MSRNDSSLFKNNPQISNINAELLSGTSLQDIQVHTQEGDSIIASAYDTDDNILFRGEGDRQRNYAHECKHDVQQHQSRMDSQALVGIEALSDDSRGLEKEADSWVDRITSTGKSHGVSGPER